MNKGQTETSGVVLEWIIDTRHGNVTISNISILNNTICSAIIFDQN